jgi:hypothetical protein
MAHAPAIARRVRPPQQSACPVTFLAINPSGSLHLSHHNSMTVYYTASMSRHDLSFAESLSSTQRSAFYERHKSLAVGMILTVFFLPFIGLYIDGMFGIVTGAVISIAAYYLTPYIMLKLS